MSGSNPGNGFEAQVRRLDAMLRQRRPGDAVAEIAALLARHPQREQSWLLNARVRQQLGDLDGMLTSARRAREVAPGSVTAAFVHAEALHACGHIAEAREVLTGIERQAGDVDIWRRLTEFHAHAGRHSEVERCARRVIELRGSDPDAAYALATALLALGRIDEAERLLDDLLRSPTPDADAYYARSTLRRQTATRNHVEELEQARMRAPTRAARVPVLYALAKELEDLGEYERAFAALEEGARTRRSLLSYQVQSDEEAMAGIIATFDDAWAARDIPGCDAEGALFIVGLPRSGTTLVDRIVSRHSAVSSAGELNDWPLAVTRIAGLARSKLELIARSASLDFGALGAAYLRALRGHAPSSRFVVDKTPLNLLYLGMIFRALPRARVLHVRRHPVASCFAMYKTLFRMGYPFSYDLGDLARYYVAYHRLMAHWRRLFPNRFLDVQYERLVDDQEGESRRILAHLGLDWDEACLRFEEHEGPVATASAAQVREPMYRHARDMWRRYEPHLQGLIEQLRRGGISIQ